MLSSVLVALSAAAGVASQSVFADLTASVSMTGRLDLATAMNLCTVTSGTPTLGMCKDNGCRRKGGRCKAFDSDQDGIRDDCICKLPAPQFDPCANVRCPSANCQPWETEVIPDGECCPKCVRHGMDCATVRCGEPDCGPFELAITQPGDCCPTCVDLMDLDLDAWWESDPIIIDPCSPSLCVNPECSLLERTVTPPGECCPKCVPIVDLTDLIDVPLPTPSPPPIGPFTPIPLPGPQVSLESTTQLKQFGAQGSAQQPTSFVSMYDHMRAKASPGPRLQLDGRVGATGQAGFVAMFDQIRAQPSSAGASQEFGAQRSRG